MDINQILENIENSYSGENLEIKSIAYDSRKVLSGSLFVAIKGLEYDGHEYIFNAIDKGALAIIANKTAVRDTSVPVIQVENTRKAMSRIASNFFNDSSKNIKITGITGTNGKTSITH